MPYTAPSLATAASDLASRLNDSDHVHWTLPELYGYIREAIRSWSAWTSCFRDQEDFTTSLGVPFYDLPTEIPTLRAYTLTNWDLVTDLQYALMEPPAAGGTWTGTDQFTLAQLTAAIQRRRDQFLRETGAVLTRTETAVASPAASGRIDLDEAVLSVRRAAWRTTATGVLYPLAVTDEWAGTHYQPTWPTSTQPPTAYSVSVTPPLSLQLIPPAIGAGTLDLVAIQAGAAVVADTEATLDIPDDFVWVLKYGVLADLLHGDGLALDPMRAAYCEARWQQGIAMARAAAVVLAGRISDVPCRIGSLSDADRYSPTWQLVAGVPRSLLLTGQNLVAIWPPPGATGGPWTITLDVVQNAPVPDIASDILQIDAGIYDSILDLAQHVALFKEGPGQLEMSGALLERALAAAGVSIKFQQASQPARAPMVGQTEQDRRAVAEQRTAILQGVEGN